MEARAELKYSRISSRKVKIVMDLIRGKSAVDAMNILKYTNKAAAPLLSKLLKSAMANAINNNNMDEKKLIVAEGYSNQGPTLKRIMPRAQGRAYQIRKRTSHTMIVLKEAGSVVAEPKEEVKKTVVKTAVAKKEVTKKAPAVKKETVKKPVVKKAVTK